ncbi:MAG: methyltransferase [Candidatus Puniceispirillum sp.]|nr:methyltransferase [Candidatus Puniceispirillum sp.]
MVQSTPPKDPMSTPLRKLQTRLSHERAMSIAHFMDFALTDPDAGYYTTTQPLGTRGDFTTSPEISPLFGEIVAARLIHAWQELGSPSPFILMELGPGRGTLMADVLRVGRRVTGFSEAAKVLLVEKSPVLRTAQKEALEPFTTPAWFETIEDALLDTNLPLFLLANEYFDALPIRQFEMTPEDWRERGVALDDEGRLTWCHLPPTNIPMLPHADHGTVKEFSPATHAHLHLIFGHLARLGGCAFICDYGYVQGWGDTLQGVKNHAYCDVLQHAGSCDISAHVDFGAMELIARTYPTLTHALTTQGAFLKENHIDVRAQQLLPHAKDKEALLAGRNRLVDEDAMGKLFKVFFVQSPLTEPTP